MFIVEKVKILSAVLLGPEEKGTMLKQTKKEATRLALWVTRTTLLTGTVVLFIFFLLKPMKKCNEDERIKSSVPRVLRSGSEKEYEYTIPTISIEKISFIETRKDIGKWDSWWDSYQWTIYMADDLDDGIVSGRGCYWSLVIDGWR